LTKVRTVELTAAAEVDIEQLLDHSAERFGPLSRRRYEALIATALDDLRADPELIGSVIRPDLGAGLRTYHIKNSQQRARTADGVVGNPRHILIYRQLQPDIVRVVRVLHDAMDLERHLLRTSDHKD